MENSKYENKTKIRIKKTNKTKHAYKWLMMDYSYKRKINKQQKQTLKTK